MRSVLLVGVMLCGMLCCPGLETTAQSTAGDRILGVYSAERDGNLSRVRITKNGDGYRAQVIWLDRPNDAQGKPRLDIHNPDPKKRTVRADQVVLIEKVTYRDGVWEDGEIYDPTSGKSYTVEVKMKDSDTLAVKGSLLLFSQTVYWKRIKE